ncbi:LPXTG cell wall anchor domain-containing protein [Kitasatospora sp. NPDC049285]|uniref:LPXTG cell wall anchor domain-containing protein n=1 Tax=Kitasatospora sp. NPDC049285 TaxID=3157096 RepID=UPI00342C6616
MRPRSVLIPALGAVLLLGATAAPQAVALPADYRVGIQGAPTQVVIGADPVDFQLVLANAESTPRAAYVYLQIADQAKTLYAENESVDYRDPRTADHPWRAATAFMPEENHQPGPRLGLGNWEMTSEWKAWPPIPLPAKSTVTIPVRLAVHGAVQPGPATMVLSTEWIDPAAPVMDGGGGIRVRTEPVPLRFAAAPAQSPTPTPSPSPSPTISPSGGPTESPTASSTASRSAVTPTAPAGPGLAETGGGQGSTVFALAGAALVLLGAVVLVLLRRRDRRR